MSDAFICRRGGIGTGGELTVNALAGVTVTAVHSTTSKSYTKTANADGVAVFKGLPEGTYNITISDGTTTTEPVSVVVSYKAETTVAFFQATINITYPAGSTCMCTCDDVSFTAPNTSGTWACIVPNAGTWTVTATNGSQTKSQAVNITYSGQIESVSLRYEVYLFKTGVGQLVSWTTSGYGVGINGGEVNDIHMSATSYPPGNAGGFGTADAIDLTDYSTLYADVKGYYYVDNSNSWQYIHIRPEANGRDGADTATFTTANAQFANYTTHSFDISGLSGKYYIFFHCRSLYQQVVDTNNVWLV